MTGRTPSAAPEIGPYSSSVAAAEFAFRSGQLPIDTRTGTLVGYAISEQTRQVLENLRPRSTIGGVDIPRGARIEIEAIAIRRPTRTEEI